MLSAKHEQYSRARATGKSQERSALDAGYGPSYAKVVGVKLDRMPAIQQRIKELGPIAQERKEISAQLNKSWVLGELRDLALEQKRLAALAEQEQDFSVASHCLTAARQCVRDIGDHLGLFEKRTNSIKMEWSGDIEGLTDQQLDNLINAMMVATYGQDEARLRAERRRLELEAGLVVDVEPVQDGLKEALEW